MTSDPAAAGRWARRVAGIILFLLAWELAGRSGVVDPLLLPVASEALGRAGGLFADGGFLGDVAATLLASAAGLALAVVVAVPLGAALGSIRRLEEAARPVIEFLRPIPSVALIPLALLLISVPFGSKVAVIVYACAWPILINTMYGLRDVDPLAKETLRSFGFGRRAVLLRVSLPSAAPFIFTGIRLSAAIALILAISIEFVAGGLPGIGQFLIEASASPEGMVDVVAAVIWAGFLGVAVNGLLAAAERRLFAWRGAS